MRADTKRLTSKLRKALGFGVDHGKTHDPVKPQTLAERRVGARRGGEVVDAFKLATESNNSTRNLGKMGFRVSGKAVKANLHSKDGVNGAIERAVRRLSVGMDGKKVKHVRSISVTPAEAIIARKKTASEAAELEMDKRMAKLLEVDHLKEQIETALLKTRKKLWAKMRNLERRHRYGARGGQAELQACAWGGLGRGGRGCGVCMCACARVYVRC